MSSVSLSNVPKTGWQPQPEAAACVHDLLAAVAGGCGDIRKFEERLLHETGNRLIDWVDHLAFPESDDWRSRLAEAGFMPRKHSDYVVWEHAGGLFPPVFTYPNATWRLAIRVEAISDFLAAHHLGQVVKIEGEPLAPLRKARIAIEGTDRGTYEFWAVERHGYRGWELQEIAPAKVESVLQFDELFSERLRHFADDEEGFDAARELVRAAVAELGEGRASDLFFAAERRYWTSRNRAARVQKARQDALGLGWANHDHHTYRSSRANFCRLIAILEEFGFVCRERFYAGREAGWGAQVLEQEESRVIIFADVDLTPDEVSNDFAHSPLAPQERFGTVGLWCLLHGEAFLEAGMHHLECQFDFEAATAQLQQAGIRVMKPFTDLPYLRQAFTAAELWPVCAARREAALASNAITPEQAEKFGHDGALGSHLEILQRDDGYKGFNQTGINSIIRATDPRRTVAETTA
jgi:hypothetical protein